LKKKIIGILVCMLIIATLAIPISAMNKEATSVYKPISIDADVPTWEIGDSWTYIIYKHVTADVNGTSGYNVDSEITFEVIDDTGDYYTLEGKITPSFGAFEIFMGNISFKSTKFMKINMDLQIRKDDLGIYKYQVYGKGKLFLSFGSLVIPFPIHYKGNIEWECDPVWPMIPFPLFDGKNGTVDDTKYIGTNGYWNFFHGLIPIAFPDSSWDSPKHTPFEVAEEQITVEAGTFDVFNVFVGWEDYYYMPMYSEKVGNVVKFSNYIEHDNGELYFYMELELKDYNYTP